MCIPCDWLLLGDVTNSLLKRNKPSILLSTCRVVYILLVSSSCGSLYQCDFKTYSLVCHVHACCHTQTDKQTHWHTERQNPFHVSALWTATTLSLSSVIAVNLVMLMIFPFSSDCHSKLPQPRHQAGGRLVSCHTPLKQADSSGVFVQHLGFFVERVVAVFSVDGGVGVLTDNDINHSDSLVIAVLQSRDW